VVVAPEGADEVVAAAARYGKKAAIIGRVIEDRDQAVYIPQKRLKGTGKEFRPE
jgi:hydrogenase maturation factor